MDPFKQQIQQRLIASVIVDKCSNCESIIFRDAWCTQERILRFTTPFFRELLEYKEGNTGHWKTGDRVMYEVSNGPDSFIVNCILCDIPAIYSLGSTEDMIKSICSAEALPDGHLYVLKSWDLTRKTEDINDLFRAFDNLLDIDIPSFEDELKMKLDEKENEGQEFKEGTPTSVKLNRYERNQKARAACLAAHGTACVVCGMDFGKVFGPEFAGKIEVHHIVPISEIGKEYVVDPEKDLVPVCPNCHMALHSKKDGVFTVDELKEIMKKRGN